MNPNRSQKSKVAAFGILTLGFLSVVALHAKNTDTYSYDHVMTTPKGTFTTKVWIKGEKKRTEMANQVPRTIEIFRGKVYIQIFPDRGFAQKMSLGEGHSVSHLASPRQGMPQNVPGSLEEGKEKDSEFTLLGEEKISKIKCQVYQWNDGRTKTKIWLSKKVPFPMKWEDVDKKEGTFSYEVRNLRIGQSMPESLFEVPSGIKLLE